MSDALLWNEIGAIYTRMGLLDESLQAYQKAVELSPNSAQFTCNLANSFFQKKEYARAISLYRKSIPLLKGAPDQSRIWNRIGDAYRAMKDLENAMQAYRQADALELHPDASPILTAPPAMVPMLTDGSPSPQPMAAAPRQESTPAVPAPLDMPVKQVPPQAPVGIPAAVQQADPAPANTDPSLEEILAKIRAYVQITASAPAHHRAWDTLGKLYKSIGRYQDAIEAYHHALENSPENDNYYYYLGLLYAAENQHDNAILAFEEVLRINPEYVLAHSALAGIFRRLGRESKASEHISAALPKMNGESSYNRACFYAICGDVELAIEFLRLAIRNNDTTLDWIKTDPDLEAIRSDERYRQMVLEFEDPNAHPADGNYFSSELEGANNQLLPLLNNSIAR